MNAQPLSVLIGWCEMVESAPLGFVSPRTERGQQTVDCTPFPCCSFMARGGKGGGLWASAMQGSERFDYIKLTIPSPRPSPNPATVSVGGRDN